MKKIITIEVKNWEKYNPKGDQKRFHWLRLNNDFFIDQKVFGLCVVEKVLFIFLLCEISRGGNSGKAEISTDFICAMLNIENRKLMESLSKLESLCLIGTRESESNTHESESNTHEFERIPLATLRNDTIRNDNILSSKLDHESNSCLDENKTTHSKTKKSDDITEQVVKYLKKKTGKKYRSSSKKTKQLINSRIREGFNFDDFKKVIDNKNSDWSNDEKMKKFIRPETLFGTKFESYLNESSDIDRARAFVQEALAIQKRNEIEYVEMIKDWGNIEISG